MADVEFSGVEDMIKVLAGADLYTEEIQQELLYAGGDEVCRCMRDEMTRSGFDLAEVAKHVEYKRKIRKDRYDNRYVTVTVTGTNAKGVSNAVIAFVLNYGRRKKYGEIIGSHFWNRGWEKGESAAIAAVEKAAAKKLEEKGLT